MSINKFYPRRIDFMRYARNGFVPEATLQWRLLEAQNHILAYRRKTFWSHSDYENRAFSAAGTVNSFRFYCHVGYGATNMVFVLGMGLDDKNTGTDPRVDIDVTEIGGSTTTYTIHHGIAETTNDYPNQISEQIARIPVTPNTTYSVLIKEIDYARILDGCAFEEGVTDAATLYDLYEGGCDQSQGSTGYPIYDQTTEDSLSGLSKAWRKNGCHLLTWAGDVDRAPPTSNSTSWKNILTDSTAAVGAASGGFYIGDPSIARKNLARRSDSTTSSATVDCVLAVYCSVTGSATGEVKIVDTAGSTLCSITGMGTAADWYTANVTITDDYATLDKCVVQYRTSNGANTVTLYAVCLYTYLA